MPLSCWLWSEGGDRLEGAGVGAGEGGASRLASCGQCHARSCVYPGVAQMGLPCSCTWRRRGSAASVWIQSPTRSSLPARSRLSSCSSDVHELDKEELRGRGGGGRGG